MIAKNKYLNKIIFLFQMGNSEEEEEEDRKARILKARLERENELLEENYKILLEKRKQDLEREIERKKMISKQIEQRVQNYKDNNRRNFILQAQHIVGYHHLNPYSMSSSELEYWHNKINEEVERRRSQMRRIVLNNNFFY